MNAIEKVSWAAVKTKVKAVNPSLFAVIEEIQPDDNIPLFLARYAFGEHFGIRNQAYIPGPSGKMEKIDSKITDPTLYQHLNYGKNSLPLGLILDKYCEWHSFGKDGRSYPHSVQGPGAIFNMQIIFDEAKTVNNNVLSVASGTTSAFMLPNIGCQRKHKRLQKQFAVSYSAPKSPFEHGKIFQQLVDKTMWNEPWQSQILYFSERFIDAVKHDEKWIKLKLYFSETLRKKINGNFLDTSCNDLFLSTESINRFRPTPFILDTAKHIFNICLGSGISIKPATDEQYLPLSKIQTIYQEGYGLEYTPTIMVPTTMHKEIDSVYYSLQCPFTKINTFKSNQSKSNLSELQVLQNVLLTYQQEFIEESGDAFGSMLYNVSRSTAFDFYHYQAPETDAIQHSSKLFQVDSRFAFSYADETKNFCSEAKLFRGCVRISR